MAEAATATRDRVMSCSGSDDGGDTSRQQRRATACSVLDATGRSCVRSATVGSLFGGVSSRSNRIVVCREMTPLSKFRRLSIRPNYAGWRGGQSEQRGNKMKRHRQRSSSSSSVRLSTAVSPHLHERQQKMQQLFNRLVVGHMTGRHPTRYATSISPIDARRTACASEMHREARLTKAWRLPDARSTTIHGFSELMLLLTD